MISKVIIVLYLFLLYNSKALKFKVVTKIYLDNNNNDNNKILNYNSYLSKYSYIVIGSEDKFYNISFNDSGSLDVKYYDIPTSVISSSYNETIKNCNKTYISTNCNFYTRVVIPMNQRHFICISNNNMFECFDYNELSKKRMKNYPRGKITVNDDKFLYLYSSPFILYIAVGSYIFKYNIDPSNNNKTNIISSYTFDSSCTFLYAFEYKIPYFLYNNIILDYDYKFYTYSANIAYINSGDNNIDKKFLHCYRNIPHQIYNDFYMRQYFSQIISATFWKSKKILFVAFNSGILSSTTALCSFSFDNNDNIVPNGELKLVIDKSQIFSMLQYNNYLYFISKSENCHKHQTTTTIQRYNIIYDNNNNTTLLYKADEIILNYLFKKLYVISNKNKNLFFIQENNTLIFFNLDNNALINSNNSSSSISSSLVNTTFTDSITEAIDESITRVSLSLSSSSSSSWSSLFIIFPVVFNIV